MPDLSTITKMSKRDRKYVAKKFIKRARKDVGYLLKPRPFWLPFNIHLWLLTKLLFLDNESLKKICLISTQNINKIKKTKTA